MLFSYEVRNVLSGRQFLHAEEILYSARHASYEESLEAGVQCFLLAIDVSVLPLCQELLCDEASCSAGLQLWECMDWWTGVVDY